MVKRTKEIQKTVTEEETIKECDYCRLMTSEDVDGEFQQMLLEPSVCNSRGDMNTTEHWVKSKIRNTTGLVNDDGQIHIEDLDEIIRIISYGIKYEPEHRADLCPNCAEQLFGDGPDTMIREGTGLLGSGE